MGVVGNNLVSLKIQPQPPSIANAVKLDGNTSLHLCTKQGLVTMVKLLLSRGADRSIKNARGVTALELAKQCNQPNIQAALR